MVIMISVMSMSCGRDSIYPDKKEINPVSKNIHFCPELYDMIICHSFYGDFVVPNLCIYNLHFYVIYYIL